MKKFAILTALFMFMLVACVKEDSKNVNQDSIYTIYELFYNTNTDKTTARATFRFGGPGGTLLELDDSASSFFNGDALLYNHLSGSHLHEYAGMVDSGVFVYNDLDLNTFTNHTPVMDTIAFPQVDTISSGSSYTFTWVGNPIQANETVTLTIDGTQQLNFEVFSNILVGATQLVLPANKLQNLGIGDATCKLQRIYNKATVDEGTSKGGRMAVWYTDVRTVYIDN